MLIWLNGQFVDRNDARISVFDAGVQHGVGLFETLTARHGRVFRAEAHVQRLIESARELLLTDRLRVRALVEALQRTIEHNELAEARLRLTVTGGDLNLLQSQGRGKVDPTVLIVAQPPTEYPPAMFERGVIATIADGRLNPLDPHAGHKTLNYWPRIRALQDSAAKGGGEALWFTVTNHLACGSVSNVILVRDGELLTPPARGEVDGASPGGEGASLPAPVLPGITRAAILELAQEQGFEARQTMLTIDDVLAADEVFLTNSSWGVLPVVGVERESIASGQVGELTQRLRNAWLELVETETQTD